MILNVRVTIDFVFKYLFGREESVPLLKHLLNSVLRDHHKHEILDVAVANPFNLKETWDDKWSIVDIRAREATGRQLNLEMQVLNYEPYPKRLVYYGARSHSQQLLEGDDYAQIKPTVCIAILDHVLFPNRRSFLNWFRLREAEADFVLTDDLEFFTIELPKFTKTSGELETEQDAWLYLIKNAETINTDDLPAALQSGVMLQAVETLVRITQSEAERVQYEVRLKAERDRAAQMKYERREGREEGRVEGRVEELIRMIRMQERLLGLAVTSVDLLRQKSVDDLAGISREFEQRLLGTRPDMGDAPNG